MSWTLWDLLHTLKKKIRFIYHLCFQDKDLLLTTTIILHLIILSTTVTEVILHNIITSILNSTITIMVIALWDRLHMEGRTHSMGAWEEGWGEWEVEWEAWEVAWGEEAEVA